MFYHGSCGRVETTRGIEDAFDFALFWYSKPTNFHTVEEADKMAMTSIDPMC
jgi:hypothetical protein